MTERLRQIQDELSAMFRDLRFDPVRHLYFVNAENYPSVSKKLEDHYEKFNKAEWLPRCAEKESRELGRVVTKWELEQKWDKKRDDACDMGHDTHDFLEHFRPGREHLADIPQKKAGMKFLQEYVFCKNPRYFIIHQEFRMIHRLFKYCGTCDLLLWDSWTDTIILLDWKTNEDLFKTYGWLKAPFTRFESNPFNKYQLQFSYYQLMIEQSKKYKINERWLVYLDNEENYTIYPTDDLTQELTEYLANPNQFSNVPATYGMVW